jgi:hypothetical protein
MPYLRLLGENKDQIDLKNINHGIIQQIAESLLQSYVLVVNEKEYRLCEIEFYVKSDQHDDKYTHGDQNQKMSGKWYFHRYRNGSYKSGTYKGMDLTLGDPETCFGILIRSLYDQDSDTVIEGPCKTVNLILGANDKNDVREYMQDKRDPLDASDTKNVYLKHSVQGLPDEPMYSGPRIGLSDKYPEWKNIRYRYVIKKNLIKKGKKNLNSIQRI